MKVLAIRYCSVSDEAESLATFFDGLGMPRKEHDHDGDDFSGAKQRTGGNAPAPSRRFSIPPEEIRS